MILWHATNIIFDISDIQISMTSVRDCVNGKVENIGILNGIKQIFHVDVYHDREIT